MKPEELLRRLGPQRTPPPLRREHTALLVVDMQEYAVVPAGGAVLLVS